jgi:ribosome-associated protein
VAPDDGGPGEQADEVLEVAGSGIRLGQLLKLAGLVGTGGEAKHALAEGLVTVNGEVDRRRGAQLVDGDVVACAGRAVRVTTTG